MTLDVYQVKMINGEWRTVPTETAARLATAEQFFRPDSVRLTTVEVPRLPRFDRWPRTSIAKGVTPRRLTAARKALAAERDKAGLFAPLLEQPTPEDRIAAIDAGLVDVLAGERARRAEQIRKARAEYKALSPDAQAIVRVKWAMGIYPPNPLYFLDVVRKPQL